MSTRIGGIKTLQKLFLFIKHETHERLVLSALREFCYFHLCVIIIIIIIFVKTDINLTTSQTGVCFASLLSYSVRNFSA